MPRIGGVRRNADSHAGASSSAQLKQQGRIRYLGLSFLASSPNLCTPARTKSLLYFLFGAPSPKMAPSVPCPLTTTMSAQSVASLPKVSLEAPALIPGLLIHF